MQNEGVVTRVATDRNIRPGAFGITWQEATTDYGRAQLARYSRQIQAELPETPGFISGIFGTIGDRVLTVSAWEKPNDPYNLLRGGTHREAAAWFFGPDVCSAGWTGVWVPERLNPRYVRCASCRQLANTDPQRCGCGAELPEAPAYW